MFAPGTKVLVTVGSNVRRGVVLEPQPGQKHGVYRVALEETETAFATEYICPSGVRHISKAPEPELEPIKLSKFDCWAPSEDAFADAFEGVLLDLDHRDAKPAMPTPSPEGDARLDPQPSILEIGERIAQLSIVSLTLTWNQAIEQWQAIALFHVASGPRRLFVTRAATPAEAIIDALDGVEKES